jgi:pimeloyl-ACP methyl ester carboxylesterase
MKEAIVLIGGYNSFWPGYLKMARDLEDVTRAVSPPGLQVIGVPLMPWYWWHARRTLDGTQILQKVQETVAWARRRLQADRVVLVGHSAGGVIARLYLHEGPVWGQVYAGVEQVTTVITLGSPHCGDRPEGIGWLLTDEANRLVPGTPYAGRVRTLAVAGRYLQGQLNGDYPARRAYNAYRYFAGQGDVWGDGAVPVQSAHLEGAEALTLEGVAHSGKYGRSWSGASKAVILRWWPQGEADAG